MMTEAKKTFAIVGIITAMLLVGVGSKGCASSPASAVSYSHPQVVTQPSPKPEKTSPAIEIVFTETVTQIEYTHVSIGDRLVATASAYCACSECCGVCTGITASGAKAKPGIVACNWLPFGTVIKFNGKTYTVADRGGSHFDIIGRIDVYFDSHQDAINFGKQDGFIEIISIPEK